ncbi:MAG: hypothetical protein D6759_06645 [Chloroflexi bacterium]|nr:MAG: hypothetical protein D6759_06645 [Chloroflexota bacterium]
MDTRSSHLNRFVAAVGTVAALGIIAVIFLLSPGSPLAQAHSAELAPTHQPPVGPPLSPPPPLHINAATPAPGAATTVSGGQADRSDLEVIPFRPHLSLRRGEVPPRTTREKPTGTAHPNRPKPPSERRKAPPEPYQAPDLESLLGPLAWNKEVYEGFEGVFPTGCWKVYDLSDDGYERSWGDTDYYAQVGSWSAWPAAAGADALDPWYDWYPDNLYSWMECGPLDFSNMTDIFVGFGLWYDTEPDYDQVYFCASVDGYNYSCDVWSGYSDGWTDQAYWLTSYAGYPEVWIAWVFISNDSISTGYEGAFVDEISIWGYELGTAPTPTPTPDPSGQLIQNGSFETGDLSHWNSLSSSGGSTGMAGGKAMEGRPLLPPGEHRPNAIGPTQGDGGVSIATVGVISSTAVEGDYAAYLWRPDEGSDFLYQTFNVPTDVTDITLDFWFAVTTEETNVGYDWFCVSLEPDDLSTIWVDLGCIDATDATGNWQEVVYSLSSAELSTVAGQSVAVVFELYGDLEGSTGTGGTVGWVDYVQVYATGSGGGTSLDPNEPNDDASSATPLACGTTISGVIGDALGGYDVDWFRLDNVPSGRLDIDIAADTQVPPSSLDSVVALWDDNQNLVAWNDDDGVSYDSYIAYTNTITNATFYVSVESYTGSGSPDAFYDLTVQCGGSGSGPPDAGNEQPPQSSAVWTVMLYLNAEDPNFESLLTQYRTDIEAFIGSKSSFLNVVILYDGPGSSDTVRYLVQPNGAYTDNVNRWNLGELNMGDPDTLANFVRWAMDQYPAQHYYLAIDDHGDGAYGISVDPTSNNDLLTPPEIYSALKSATHDGARKIDLFDYEACLMGLAENAYDLRQWVDYVIFSEQISWGINTYPTYFSDLTATDTPLDVGRRIVDRYHAGAIGANGGWGYPHTISLVDTSRMDILRDAVSNFGDALRVANQRGAINNARDRSQAFANDLDATNPARADYVDLWDLADEASSLVPTQAAAVKSAVEAAVVVERHASGGVSGYIWDHKGAHGLAIYYPSSQSSNAFGHYATLYRMSQDGTWDEFLAWAVPTGTRRGMSAFRSQDKLVSTDAFVFRYVYLPMVLK